MPDDGVPGDASAAAPSSAGSRTSSLVRQACEHVQVLPLDDRPVVMVAEELPAVSAERAAQPSVLLERAQRLDELAVALVVESGVAAEALALQHVALAVGEHRPAERPGFERHHRQAFEVGRHDQQIGGRHRVELVRVVQEAEVPDARVLGNRQQRVADQHQRQPAGGVAQVALEELEQLRAALVLVDPADVDRERSADVVLLTEPGRLRILRARRTRCRQRRRARPDCRTRPGSSRALRASCT